MRTPLCLVLHAHLPFVRHLGGQPYLEENWLPEAILECYIPLLQMLDRLEADNRPGELTFTITPTLAAMLGDPLLQQRTRTRLDKLCGLAEAECARHSGDALAEVTAHYRARFTAARDYYAACGGDLLSVFRHHNAAGRIAIITCAATHALLPLLTDARAVERQIAVGVRSHTAVFGTPPRGIWLPECAYFPGAGEILRRHGIAYTILAAHAFLYAAPRPAAGVYAPLLTPEGITVFGRDPECSQQVWSATEGYPGDGTYREFYRDLGWDGDLEDINPCLRAPGLRHDLGLKYYRITGSCPLERKEYYQPEAAARRAHEHARDFLDRRARQIARVTAMGGRPPVLTAPYDAELFGHWWYEGPVFLEEILRLSAADSSPVRCVTLESLLDRALQKSRPAGSSWGDRGYFSTWLNGDNDWIYPRLYAAQAQLNTWEDRPAKTAPERRAREQATRELLLAQASDWPFIISNHTMADYAERRVNIHLARLQALVAMGKNGAFDEHLLGEWENEDNLFSAEILRGAVKTGETSI